MVTINKNKAKNIAILSLLSRKKEFGSDFRDINNNIINIAKSGQFGLAIPVVSGVDPEYYVLLQKYYTNNGFKVAMTDKVVDIVWD